jgi:hypothetical protein
LHGSPRQIGFVLHILFSEAPANRWELGLFHTIDIGLEWWNNRIAEWWAFKS